MITPRWQIRTGWFLSVLVVAQLLSSAFFRGTQHSYAVAEIVTGYGFPVAVSSSGVSGGTGANQPGGPDRRTEVREAASRAAADVEHALPLEIGRASCRERV